MLEVVGVSLFSCCEDVGLKRKNPEYLNDKDADWLWTSIVNGLWTSIVN